MRTLVLADIHSNWAALAAIREEFDQCLVIGDLVDYGTDPVPCIDWVRQHATCAVRGNHDHAVAQHIAPRNGGGFRRLAAATRPLHWDVLDPSRLRYLARLPVIERCEIDGLRVMLVHATPRDPLDEYLGNDPDAWSERIAEVDADLICVGHTHQPYLLEVDGRRVLNPGSVGQPRDGDPRAAYAVIEAGRIELRRVEYDIEASLNQMRQTGVDPWVTELTASLLRTGAAMTREEMDQIR
ncbi:MAG: metallophosphoesterase family protein [Planctomycetaceae bacterium]|nr:metallophosphoesterase family protein [Planctomycetaceae bacterium]